MRIVMQDIANLIADQGVVIGNLSYMKVLIQGST